MLTLLPNLEVRAETFRSCIADIACFNRNEAIIDRRVRTRCTCRPLSFIGSRLGIERIICTASLALDLLREVMTVPFLAVAALQRQRSSTREANVSVFVIDMRGCEESVCRAVRCTATFFGSDNGSVVLWMIPADITFMSEHYAAP